MNKINKKKINKVSITCHDTWQPTRIHAFKASTELIVWICLVVWSRSVFSGASYTGSYEIVFHIRNLSWNGLNLHTRIKGPQTKNKDLARNYVSTESMATFGGSCIVYLAVVQVDWVCIGWEMWSYVWGCSFIQANHDKPIKQLKTLTCELSWISVKKLTSFKDSSFPTNF